MIVKALGDVLGESALFLAPFAACLIFECFRRLLKRDRSEFWN